MSVMEWIGILIVALLILVSLMAWTSARPNGQSRILFANDERAAILETLRTAQEAHMALQGAVARAFTRLDKIDDEMTTLIIATKQLADRVDALERRIGDAGMATVHELRRPETVK